jgi:hypothetical protein
MRVRILQVLDEDEGRWVDEAYAIENEAGQVEFRYNTLTWGRVGASLNQQIQKEKLGLEKIESVIPSNAEARWLDIDVLEDQTLDEAITALDDTCRFPKPRPVAVANPTVA